MKLFLWLIQMPFCSYKVPRGLWKCILNAFVFVRFLCSLIEISMLHTHLGLISTKYIPSFNGSILHFYSTKNLEIILITTLEVKTKNCIPSLLFNDLLALLWGWNQPRQGPRMKDWCVENCKKICLKMQWRFKVNF